MAQNTEYGNSERVTGKGDDVIALLIVNNYVFVHDWV